MNRQLFQVESVKESNLEEIVQFLIDNFAQTEAILASLKMDEDQKCLKELSVMIRDLVQDSLQCSSTCVIRDPDTRKIDGIAVACKTSIFDKQIDRLCAYEFEQQPVRDAVEFLKYVFNKLDVMYYLNEARLSKPFAAVRYDAFKGEHLRPPIVMQAPEKFTSVYAMLAKFQ
ncbi:hypothetical protein CAEBREN_30651 [Caenorhabditis brenneri]|uniref:Uncharacterized protein n=1 Tax=Caenorhabditis brenneri TaxID=135651 RepID=G0PJ53_CAEBE|nr:hypothetical protein CAEBREN_30651 [Caenorhabditis brenneri]